MGLWRLKPAILSEIGRVKDENQDRVLVRIGEDATGDIGLFAVADGMGSQRGGAQAAEIALRCLDDWWFSLLPGLLANARDSRMEAIAGSLKEMIHHMDEGICGLGQRLDSRPGTTVSVLFLRSGTYSFAHIGDSRIYRMDAAPRQLTTDDTWVAREVRAGRMTPETAELHPRRHVLTQCAGLGETIEPHQGTGTLIPGARLLLCSDGFYTPLGAEELAGFASGPGPLEASLKRASDLIHSRGARDNLSAILVETELTD